MAGHGSTLNRTLSEHVNYPPHPPRHPTKLFEENHRRMVVVEDRPCIACGVRHSDLQDPARRADPTINPWEAVQIELHHHTIEDSLANAIDVTKFNQRVRPGLLRRTGNHAKYGHDFTREEMIEWIHGDEDNLWPICDPQHRSVLIGIHCVTGPIWGVQDILLDGFDLTGYHPTTPHEAAQLMVLPQTTGQPEPVTVVPQTTGQAEPPAPPEPTP